MRVDANDVRLVLLVAIGGAIGSVLRYAVSGFLNQSDFPWGTFAVNFSGTFLLALLFFVLPGHGDWAASARTFTFAGLFGGYTTFSTFGVETVELVRVGSLRFAALNVGLNGGLCVAGAFAGATIGSFLASAL